MAAKPGQSLTGVCECVSPGKPLGSCAVCVSLAAVFSVSLPPPPSQEHGCVPRNRSAHLPCPCLTHTQTQRKIKASSISNTLTLIMQVKSIIMWRWQYGVCVCVCSYSVAPHLQQRWGYPVGTAVPQTT